MHWKIHSIERRLLYSYSCGILTTDTLMLIFFGIFGRMASRYVYICICVCECPRSNVRMVNIHISVAVRICLRTRLDGTYGEHLYFLSARKVLLVKIERPRSRPRNNGGGECG